MRDVYPMDLFRDCLPDEETSAVEKSQKCNQCEYASTNGSSLKRHLMQQTKWRGILQQQSKSNLVNYVGKFKL